MLNLGWICRIEIIWVHFELIWAVALPKKIWIYITFVSVVGWRKIVHITHHQLTRDSAKNPRINLTPSLPILVGIKRNFVLVRLTCMSLQHPVHMFECGLYDRPKRLQYFFKSFRHTEPCLVSDLRDGKLRKIKNKSMNASCICHHSVSIK